MNEESFARDKWNRWSEAAKRAFIEYHEFNPRFANYAWQMLPYSVQRLVMAEDDISTPEVPIHHIVGQCSNCGYAYDLKGGIQCPSCGWEGISWAYHATSDDEQADLIQRMRNKLSEPKLTDGDLRDIAELERMFKL